MKIYFAGSMRGGRQDTKLYAEIIENLREHGEVLTEHVGDIVDDSDRGISDADIYEYSMLRLLDADIVIAEVTQPSIGVGYEIGASEALEKPIVCLFRVNAGFQRSPMIASERIDHIEYKNLQDLTPKLKALFDSPST